MLVHTASYTVRGECHQIAEFRGRDVEMQRNRGADGGYNGTSVGANGEKAATVTTFVSKCNDPSVDLPARRNAITR